MSIVLIACTLLIVFSLLWPDATRELLYKLKGIAWRVAKACFWLALLLYFGWSSWGHIQEAESILFSVFIVVAWVFAWFQAALTIMAYESGNFKVFSDKEVAPRYCIDKVHSNLVTLALVLCGSMLVYYRASISSHGALAKFLSQDFTSWWYSAAVVAFFILCRLVMHFSALSSNGFSVAQIFRLLRESTSDRE